MIKVTDALAGVNRLGVDTPLFIYLVERFPRYVDVVRAVFKIEATWIDGDSRNQVRIHPIPAIKRIEVMAQEQREPALSTG